MSVLLEGVASVALPCTFALLIPAVGIVLSGWGQAPRVAAGFVIGAASIVWARAAGHWSVVADGPIAVLAAMMLVGAAAMLWWGGPRGDAIVAGAAAGAVMGWLWRPCVGSALATVLNDAPIAPLRTLAELTLYMAGVCLPALVLAALPVAVPALVRWRDHRVVVIAGASIVAATAALVAIGVYDDVVAELLLRSSF